MAFLNRVRHILLDRSPDNELSIQERFISTIVGLSKKEIAKRLKFMCEEFSGTPFLIDAQYNMRVGNPSNHQRLILAEYSKKNLLNAIIGTKGFLLIGNHPLVTDHHLGLAWESPNDDFIKRFTYDVVSTWHENIPGYNHVKLTTLERMALQLSISIN